MHALVLGHFAKPIRKMFYLGNMTSREALGSNGSSNLTRLVISAAPTKKCSAYSFISQDNQPNGSTKLYGFYPGL